MEHDSLSNLKLFGLSELQKVLKLTSKSNSLCLVWTDDTLIPNLNKKGNISIIQHRCVHATIAAVEQQYVLHILSVFIALDIQRAMCLHLLLVQLC